MKKYRASALHRNLETALKVGLENFDDAPDGLGFDPADFVPYLEALSTAMHNAVIPTGDYDLSTHGELLQEIATKLLDYRDPIWTC